MISGGNGQSRYYSPGGMPGNGFGGRNDLRERPTSELVNELLEEAQHVVGEGQRLVREEVRLAKEEIKKDVGAYGRGAGLFGAAGAVGYAAVLSFTAAAILLLALVMPLWGAAILVGIFLAAVAGLLAFAGKTTVDRVKLLDETSERVKEDKQWASETMRAARSNSRANA